MNRFPSDYEKKAAAFVAAATQTSQPTGISIDSKAFLAALKKSTEGFEQSVARLRANFRPLVDPEVMRRLRATLKANDEAMRRSFSQLRPAKVSRTKTHTRYGSQAWLLD